MNVKNVQNESYSMFEIFDDYASENNINYLFHGGNYIGAYRNQDFLEWDEDIDVFIFEKDRRSIIECFKNNEDYVLLETGKLDRKVTAHLKVISKKFYGYKSDSIVYPYFDIFVISKQPKFEGFRKYIYKIYSLIEISKAEISPFGIKNFIKFTKLKYNSYFRGFVIVMSYFLRWLRPIIKFPLLLGKKSCYIHSLDSGLADLVLTNYAFDINIDKEENFKGHLNFRERKIKDNVMLREIIDSYYGDWKTPPKDHDPTKYISEVFPIVFFDSTSKFKKK